MEQAARKFLTRIVSYIVYIFFIVMFIVKPLFTMTCDVCPSYYITIARAFGYSIIALLLWIAYKLIATGIRGWH